MNCEPQKVLIIGSYINACSLANDIYQVAPQIPVVIIDTAIENDMVCLADIAAPHAEVVKSKVKDEESFLQLLHHCTSEHETKIILFTDEEWIDTVKIAIENKKLCNTLSYTGAGVGNDVIFDRLKFYRFIESLNCAEVPKTVDSDQDPLAVFGESFVFRFKRSWDGMKKIPRLLLIQGRDMFERVYADFLAQGFTPDEWCYQELLSTVDQHNISVCGWHDEEYQQYAVTRKVVQHPPKTGNGDVVEALTDFPQELIAATQTILSELQYRGAFEMEYLYDNCTQTYKVIELNPRFWMQHQLVNKATDHALIKRALGIAAPKPIAANKLQSKYWINGNRMLYYLATLDMGKLRYALRGRWYPGIVQSIRWGMYYKKYKQQTNR